MNAYDVVLLPTFAQVEEYRKEHAVAGADGAGGLGGGLFGQRVSTFAAWVADLWELFGDGRLLVDSVERLALVRAAMGEVYGEDALQPGMAPLGARLARQAAGLPAFEVAVEAAGYGEFVAAWVPAPALDAAEQKLLSAMARYNALLVALERIELGQACAYLADHAAQVFPRPVRVALLDAAPLDWMQAHFFAACGNVELVVLAAPGADGVARMPEGVQLRFAFPAGAYAQPGLVADIVRAHGAEGPVVVACADPLDMYKQVEPALAAEGVAACAQAQVPFAQTDFGRAYLSLWHVVNDGAFNRAALSDALLSPFSGIDRKRALELDTLLRADRIADRDAWLRVLCAESDMFSHLEELARDPEADVMLGAFEQMAWNLLGRSREWRAEQLGAIGGLRAVLSAARRAHMPMAGCAVVLEQVGVADLLAGVLADDDACGRAGGLAGGAVAAQPPQVTFTTQAVAAAMPAGGCATLVLADMTSESYPVADSDDAATTLLAKLGLVPTDTALARARRAMRALQQLPTDRMVVVRPLNNADAEPTYPCVVAEELVDAYRADPTDMRDVANPFRLPAELQEGLLQRGEELLAANARAARAEAPDVQAACAAGCRVVLRPDEAAPYGSWAVLPRRTQDGAPLPGVRLSPSQLEAYLECPYRWLAQRRLHAEPLDEQFGPLEKGTYAHAALEAFYRRFLEAGHARVEGANLQKARTTMRAVLEELRAEQFQMPPGSGRLVPGGPLEARQLDALERQLVNHLDVEAVLLPGFRPAYLEYRMEPEKAVPYAGVLVTGTVDRIDVDDAGHAVIVDYKGSVGPAHFIAGKTLADPGKVQTRIYARVVERLLGVQVLGALYVGYGRTPAVGGAADARLELGQLPVKGLDKTRCAPEDPPDVDAWRQLPDAAFAARSFAGMLDATEELVEAAAQRLCAGEVPQRPSSPDACRWCNVPSCPNRGA